MTVNAVGDPQALVGSAFHALADAVEARGPQLLEQPSLCTGWTVGHVLAHVTMAARYSPAEFGAELVAVGYDFEILSQTIAARDAARTLEDVLADLRAETMATWVPPGGGPIGALTHVVIHGLDVTAANGMPRSAPDAAAVAVLDALTGGGVAAHFGVDASEFRLTATDLGWHHGDGVDLTASAGDLILALAGRPRPGIPLPRV
ncbi:MAG: maleylpyruvate isomerase family mycothiol-dependent enzyme [Dermatophilaceae bacterium]